MNAARFLEFLNNEFWDAINDIPLQVRLDMYFQLDGASIHNALTVRQWLDQNYPQKWIGRNSRLILWPPRSPDLTPLDFYLWGTIKAKIYKGRPQNLEELRDRITQACQQSWEITKIKDTF